MTKEEAVEHLDTIGQYYSQDHSDPYDECERLTKDELDAIYLAIKALEQEPCYNPDEWCHDCKEYDHDKHCCPRYNKVIRNTVEEMKRRKTGYISIDDVMSVFDDFMCGEVDEDETNTFLEMLKDKVKSEEQESCNNVAVTHKNLCDSCTTQGCVFQSGIIRNHCDFYKEESEET